MTIWPEKPALPFLAFALEAIFSRITVIPPFIVIPLVYFLLFWFIACNLRQGIWVFVFGIGTLLNFAVIAANGLRMPVSEALFRDNSWQDVYLSLLNGEIFGYEAAGAQTKLGFLGDIFALAPGGELLGFASVGDLFLLLGVLLLGAKMLRAAWNQKRKAQDTNTKGNRTI